MGQASRLNATSPARLRVVLAGLFVALAVPSAIVIRQAFARLELDSFRRYQLLAEEFVERVDGRIAAAVAIENARPFDDYAFLREATTASSVAARRSPLSMPPGPTALPGLVGYFQIDAEGRFTTPLLPAGALDLAAFGLDAAEVERRRGVESELARILAAGSAAALRPPASAVPEAASAEPPPAVASVAEEAAPSQALFDRLGAAGVERAASGPAAKVEAAPGRAEAARRGAALAGAAAESDAERQASVGPADRASPAASAERITVFTGEIDGLVFARLDAEHFVMFRNAWRGGRRFVQGAVLDAARFVAGAVGPGYGTSALGGAASLGIAYRGEPLTGPAPAAPGHADSVLYQARLSPPLADLALVFDARNLPAAPGRALIVWASFVLAAALVGGFLVLYRLGLGQIRFARQQREFVSAVSHELKTPLTSIRMYGEMLEAGWADEAKKQTYYRYIYAESERLSRLIDNVLKLARLNRGELGLVLEPVAVGELLETALSRVATPVERAGFTIELKLDPRLASARIQVDADAFVQIFINLVDNALKFASRAQRKRIEVSARPEGRDRIVIGVRDFGPGVARAQMRRLFELFYRPADEVTRSTPGTGIGLGLVKQLAAAMGANVDVDNCDPGVEFRIGFPRAS